MTNFLAVTDGFIPLSAITRIDLDYQKGGKVIVRTGDSEATFYLHQPEIDKDEAPIKAFGPETQKVARELLAAISEVEGQGTVPGNGTQIVKFNSAWPAPSGSWSIERIPARS